MKWLLAALALTLLPEARVEFVPVDIYIDTNGKPLAAYQFELNAKNAVITGLEGDEKKIYGEAPYYDAEALRGGRIIVAGFSTAESLPVKKIRVATLHMMEEGEAEYSVKLIVAGEPGGRRLDAKITVVRRGKK